MTGRQMRRRDDSQDTGVTERLEAGDRVLQTASAVVHAGYQVAVEIDEQSARREFRAQRPPPTRASRSSRLPRSPHGPSRVHNA